jgi:thioredoxin reductase (NADPH)
MTQHTCDLLVVGGGPAGLSAAINGASEGLKVCVIDGAQTFGGQARESRAIENYPGFIDGITGDALTSTFVQQALKFNTELVGAVSAQMLHQDGNRLVVTTDDYSEFAARAVILSNGLSYRRHPAAGIGPLLGRGVYYGMPSFATMRKGSTAIVVGGANSAGQAAVHLCRVGVNVKLLIRKRIEDQMSQYLIDRLRAAPNAEVIEGADVLSVSGNGKGLEEIEYERGGERYNLEADCLFFFIGAIPRTLWLHGTIALDDRKFIVTGNDVTTHRALPFETSIPGVFAVGDVRKGSTKRVAAAIGEGAAGLQSAHGHFARIAS